jgi:hypothetical protein
MALNHHPFTLVAPHRPYLAPVTSSRSHSWMEAIMPSSVARLVVEEVIASEWRLLAGLMGSAASVEQLPGNAPQILVNRDTSRSPQRTSAAKENASGQLETVSLRNANDDRS